MMGDNLQSHSLKDATVPSGKPKLFGFRLTQFALVLVIGLTFSLAIWTCVAIAISWLF